MSARDPTRGHGSEPVIDDELAEDLLELRQHIEERRMSMFRDFTARRVRLASPLLIDACRPGELDDGAWRLAPGSQWPMHQISSYTLRGWSARSSRHGPYRFELPDKSRFVNDRLVLRVTNRAAHMVLVVDRAAVHTNDSGGMLALPSLVPSDARRSLIGSPLERVFHHPSVAEQPYIIQTAEPDEVRRRTMFRFAAAPMEWRVPWARPWVS